MMIGRVNVESLKAEIQKMAMERTEAKAEAVCQRAKELAPVETGRLKNSIRVYRKGNDFFVGSDCAYALAVEFGTRRRSARPFLTAAVEMEKKV